MGVRAYLMAAAVGVAGVLSSPAAWAETLADAMVAAYKNSRLLDQNEALLRAQDENVAQAVARLRPVTHRTKSPRLRLVKNPDDEPVDPHRIIDPLLEKISKDGLASLTRREREQLEHARAVLLEQERR